MSLQHIIEFSCSEDLINHLNNNNNLNHCGDTKIDEKSIKKQKYSQQFNPEKLNLVLYQDSIEIRIPAEISIFEYLFKLGCFLELNGVEDNVDESGKQHTVFRYLYDRNQIHLEELQQTFSYSMLQLICSYCASLEDMLLLCQGWKSTELVKNYYRDNDCGVGYLPSWTANLLTFFYIIQEEKTYPVISPFGTGLFTTPFSKQLISLLFPIFSSSARKLTSFYCSMCREADIKTIQFINSIRKIPSKIMLNQINHVKDEETFKNLIIWKPKLLNNISLNSLDSYNWSIIEFLEQYKDFKNRAMQPIQMGLFAITCNNLEKFKEIKDNNNFVFTPDRILKHCKLTKNIHDMLKFFSLECKMDFTYKDAEDEFYEIMEFLVNNNCLTAIDYLHNVCGVPIPGDLLTRMVQLKDFDRFKHYSKSIPHDRVDEDIYPLCCEVEDIKFLKFLHEEYHLPCTSLHFQRIMDSNCFNPTWESFIYVLNVIGLKIDQHLLQEFALGGVKFVDYIYKVHKNKVEDLDYKKIFHNQFIPEFDITKYMCETFSILPSAYQLRSIFLRQNAEFIKYTTKIFDFNTIEQCITQLFDSNSPMLVSMKHIETWHETLSMPITDRMVKAADEKLEKTYLNCKLLRYMKHHNSEHCKH